MNWGQRRRKGFFLAFVAGMGVLISSERLLAAEPTDPTGAYQRVRETTLRYVALGTTDDLLRLREAFDKTEQEIARLRLEIPPEKQDQLAEKQTKLKEMKDRLAESQALLQLLDTSSREVSKKQLDPSNANERELLRKELSGRNDDLKKRIADLEKETRSSHAEYLQTLEEERKALARLLTVRRERLLVEYQSLSGCTNEDRPCLARKLKILCKLTALFPTGSRPPITVLLQEVSDQLHLGRGTTSSLCDYLKHDFGP